MEDSLFWGIPKSAYESADRMLTLARNGGIRQHLLGDTTRIRHGTIEDQSVDEYCNFLQTKQGEKTTPAACCREEQKGRNAGWTAE